MDSAIYTIADIGQAHEGSLDAAHHYIDLLADTGVDAAKFQVHIAEAESSEFEVFRIPPITNETRMQYWKRMEFTPDEWAGLKQHCENVNLDFLATPCSIRAVELLKKLNVDKLKIGSGDTCNLLMLDIAGKTGKELIISTGMSSISELDTTSNFLKKRNIYFTLLQCASDYPSLPNQWGLNQIQDLQKRYDVPTGYSDHSGDIYASLAAATLGAEIIEFHVIDNKRSHVPDASSSLTPNQIKQLVTGIKAIETALKNPVNKTDISHYERMKNLFEKSLSINRSLPAGHVLSMADLETKKPRGKGIPANEYEAILGKKLSLNMKQWDFITKSDVV
ncbi:MAG TPA: N-acetylneuraminate synthase family protein [Dyadobacter sp.]|jgi:N-acetylneuraminate synthase|nr:N-acetylneuraminate synthase family protein [Dyadobacter sp.]